MLKNKYTKRIGLNVTRFSQAAQARGEVSISACLRVS